MSTQTFSLILRKIAGAVGILIEKPLFLALKLMPGGVIVVYHRVLPYTDPFYPPIHPFLFRQQLEIIRNNFLVLSLDEFVGRLQSHHSPRGCCALAFDDGYQDFQDYASPILLKPNIPAAHFVTNYCLLQGNHTWNYRLNRLLHHMCLSDVFMPKVRITGPPSWDEILRLSSLLSSFRTLESDCTNTY